MGKRGRPKKHQEPVIEHEEQAEENSGSFLRFGESYTSLLLGIIVVIISTVLLLSFVHNKNVDRNKGITPQAQQDSRDIAQISEIPSLTVNPTTNEVTPTPTIAVTSKPTAKPSVNPTVTTKPTVKPTVKPSVTVVPTQVVEKKGEKPAKATHAVKTGETLWSIAEKYYKSGYNWVDIARVNNLSNPDSIDAGMKLTIPNVEPKVATVIAPEANKGSPSVAGAEKITGTSYKVVKGDDLWDISVRAYGDGYNWVDIARVNNLSNPDIIHPGTVLKLPRDTGKK